MLLLLCLLLTLTFPIIRSCLVILAFSYHVLNIECIQCIEHQKYAHLQTEQLIVQTLLFFDSAKLQERLFKAKQRLCISIKRDFLYKLA